MAFEFQMKSFIADEEEIGFFILKDVLILYCSY